MGFSLWWLGLHSAGARVVVAPGLQSTDSIVVVHWAHLLHGMWDLPRLGIKTHVSCVDRLILYR